MNLGQPLATSKVRSGENSPTKNKSWLHVPKMAFNTLPSSSHQSHSTAKVPGFPSPKFLFYYPKTPPSPTFLPHPSTSELLLGTGISSHLNQLIPSEPHPESSFARCNLSCPKLATAGIRPAPLPHFSPAQRAKGARGGKKGKKRSVLTSFL